MKSVWKKIADTSPAAASTAAGDTVYDLAGYDTYVVTGRLIGATGGTLDVYLQDYDDVLEAWVDWVHFTQIADAGAARIEVYSPALENTKSTVGSGTAPVLASGTCRGGPPRGSVRALYVAGVGTSVGAAVTISIHCSNSRQ